MGHVLMSANQQPVFTAVSAGGNAVFLSGSSVRRYQIGLDGTVLKRTLAAIGNTAWQAEYTRVMQRGMAADSLIRAGLSIEQRYVLPNLGNFAAGGVDFL